MNKKLAGLIIFVVVVLLIIGGIALYKNKAKNETTQNQENEQTNNQEIATTDLASSNDDFIAIEEGLDRID